ncbi:MAG: hypothetical protein AAFV37_03220 [Pseudomonadota bacterium]
MTLVRELIFFVVLSTLIAQSAMAQICNLEVYKSNSGALLEEVDETATFSAGEEYIICFSSGADGYVSLWDRLPINSPVTRLVPNEFQTQSFERAVFVSRTDRHCFGSGEDGYFLHMDPDDGLGVGVMWLLYQRTESLHPDEGSFDSAAKFDQGYVRYGAGAKQAPGFGNADTEKDSERTKSCASNTKTLLYRYRVQ